jgi:adenylate cyclase class 2
VIEQEVKLRFASPEAARAAVTTAGGRLISSRHLQDDRLFDTADGRLLDAGVALRVRREEGRALLTFKGPVIAGVVKSREEIETRADDADALTGVLEAIGFQPWFRYQKIREGYGLGDARVFVDETPIGVFIEIEGSIDVIMHVAASLGCSTADFVLDSYRRLYVEWCESRGIGAGDMVFGSLPG